MHVEIILFSKTVHSKPVPYRLNGASFCPCTKELHDVGMALTRKTGKFINDETL
jgi:hypothetical protein